jgi:hypothetical protein
VLTILNNVSEPHILKASKILGRNLVLKNASTFDAQFILSLRVDEEKSKFLSKTSNDLEAQKKWLREYEEKNFGEAYFIIQTRDAKSIGTVRIYDEVLDSFSWGSWILSKDAPSSAAIESSLIVYEYAVNNLKFSSAHFEVLKENERVWQFHKRFGAIQSEENGEKYFFKIDKPTILKSLSRYSKYLPNGIVVNE